jgi:hypothetical protein
MKRLFLLLVTICLLQQWLPAQTPKIIPAANGSTRLKLNQRFYSQGDMASARVLFQKVLPTPNLFVLFVSPKTGDAEAVPLTKISDLEYATTATLKINYATGKTPKDGILNVEQGEAIVAYYYANDFKEQKPANPQANQPVNPKTNAINTKAVIAPMYINKQEPDMACDFALIRGTENYMDQFKVNKAYALTKTEVADKAATVVVPGEMPVQIANNRVIYYSRNQQELKEFLVETKGILIGMITQQQPTLTHNLPGNTTGGAAHLIEIPMNGPDKAQNLADLGQLRSFLGFKQKINASSEEALQVISFVSLANLDGYAVSLNPRMQFDADFNNNTEETTPTNNIINPPGAGEDIPGSFIESRTNIQKVWNYMAIWERDVARINVAIIDYGYNPNNDYRNLSTLSQCAADPVSVRCGSGVALGVPTVGAGLFGGRVWHGNAVQARIGGVLNNNFGTAGTGGQVVVPQIIKLSGAEAYAFNIGGAIRQAVNNGAHVINISGSFPCRALTSIGDFTYCEPGVRGAICATLFPIVQAGAVAGCATLQAAIPLPGVFELCIGGTSSAYISACTAQMMLGNPGEIISSAVQFAKSRGVPVVACAGNFMTREDLSGVPDDLRALVNLDENRMRVEEWNIVPGSLPDVICVGASLPSGNFANAQIFGNRVDVWGPQDGIYVAPTSGTSPAGPSNPDITHRTFNGTSSSTPFITGLVADAMAVNPQLRRGTSSRTASIVADIRELLVSTAWSTRELPVDPTGRRRNLVNPIRFIQAAAFFEGSGVPTFPSTIYNTNWNIEPSETTTSDDATPTAITFSRTGVARTGSIIFIAGSGGAADIADVDRFNITVPASYSGPAGERMTFRLRTPRGFGNLVIRGTGITLTSTTPVGSNEEEKLFTGPVITPGSSVAISVEGSSRSDDNIYRLSIGNAPAPSAGTTSSTVSLDEIGILCPNILVRGDRELNGGPLINASVQLDVTPDGTGIDAIVTFNERETGGDNSEVRGEWRVRVFNAPDGQRITAITSAARSNIVNYRGRGGGFEVSIFGCNDGAVEDATVSGGPVRTFSLIADTGGEDISGDNDCRCDSRIQRIAFNPVTITTIRL